MNIIEMENVSKRYKIEKKYSGFKGTMKSLINREYEIVNAVDNISLKVEEGEILGYIGPNGAGKSTTIKMLTGILHPTSGKVFVNGIEPYAKRRQNAKNIGAIFGQRNQLFWDLPVRDSFEFNKQLYGIPEEIYNKKIRSFEEYIDIGNIIDKPVRKLSLGQKMKANFALSFLHNPKVVYLDEPTIGLDGLTKEGIREFILEENRKYHTTVLFTSHDMEDIRKVCNKIILINNGEKSFEASLEEFVDTFAKYDGIVFSLGKEYDEKVSRAVTKQINETGKELRVKEFKGNTMIVEYNRRLFTSIEVIKYVISNFNLDILDVKTRENSIDDIVKEIYRSKKGEKIC